MPIGEITPTISRPVVRPTRTNVDQQAPPPAVEPVKVRTTAPKKPVTLPSTVQDHQAAQQTLLGSLKLSQASAPQSLVQTNKPPVIASASVGPVGASATGEIHSTNLLDKTPLGIQGRLGEAAGTVLKTSADGLHQLTETLDANAHRVPTTQARTALGMVSGTLGFASSTFDGLGSAAQTTGRLTRGDKQTWTSALGKARGLGEAYSYVAGSTNVAAGRGLESLGQKTGVGALSSLGEKTRRVGNSQQALAGERTRGVVDQLANTGLHYSARVAELQNRAEGSALDRVGLDRAAGYLRSEAEDQKQLGDKTRTGLSDALDQAARDRVSEYRSEGGDYAASRDLTRAAWEIGTIVFAPESAAGKADKGADLANGVNHLGDLAAAGDKLTDAERTLEKASQAGRALHGERFNEVRSPWQSLQDGTNLRQVADAKDGGIWNEIVTADGRHVLQRPGANGGVESIQGSNRWVARDQQALSEAAAGKHRVLQAGDRRVLVQGDATPEQITNLQAALDRLPPGAQKHLPQDIYVNHDLGSILDVGSGALKEPIAGLGGNGSILLHDQALESADNAFQVVSHELGHELDNALGGLSNDSRWVPGRRPVTDYAGTNAAENLAEHSKLVLGNWEKFDGRSALGWLFQKDRSQFAQLVNEYGGSLPGLAQRFL